MATKISINLGCLSRGALAGLNSTARPITNNYRARLTTAAALRPFPKPLGPLHTRYISRLNQAICNQTTISRAMSSAPQTDQNPTDEVTLHRTDQGMGTILLTRPKALNALSLPMVRKIYNQLRNWETDPQMKMVIIKSASEKAFCAGGDVKNIALQGPGSELSDSFFREEYRMDNLIGSLSMPVVALIDGICMGGGVGLSVHAPFRIVTERAVFAMPETAIGFFPDVGGSHFLPRLPGKLGLFLGLTGHRLTGRDIFKAGVGTHFVPSDKLKFLEEELMRLPRADNLTIAAVCSKYQEQWEADFKKEFSLKPQIGRINAAFGSESVEKILENLSKDPSEFAKKTLETLKKLSPTSLKVSFEQINRGASLSLPECLMMEFRISQRMMVGHDFFEGVRSVLIDKDHNPKWKPERLEDVTPEMVNSYFEKLPQNKELAL